MYEVILDLCKGSDSLFHLAQEFYWHNPARIPGPAEWTNVRRIRVKDAVTTIWWLSKTPNPKADNRKILTDYKNDMRKLLSSGYNTGKRPSGHCVSSKWAIDHGGAIPPNFLNFSNTTSRDPYIEACRSRRLKVHPARFQKDIPDFFIRFLTDPGDMVMDPFSGSNTVGFVAENLGRRWVSIENKLQYVEGSYYRFRNAKKSP